MGSVRFNGVTFRLYAGDHEGAPIPHAHARFDHGEVIIELLDDGTVRLSNAHRVAVLGDVKRSDVRRAIDTAEAAYDLLLAEWKAMHP
jgi:hypothetical protein